MKCNKNRLLIISFSRNRILGHSSQNPHIQQLRDIDLYEFVFHHIFHTSCSQLFAHKPRLGPDSLDSLLGGDTHRLAVHWPIAHTAYTQTNRNRIQPVEKPWRFFSPLLRFRLLGVRCILLLCVLRFPRSTIISACIHDESVLIPYMRSRMVFLTSEKSAVFYYDFPFLFLSDLDRTPRANWPTHTAAPILVAIKYYTSYIENLKTCVKFCSSALIIIY